MAKNHISFLDTVKFFCFLFFIFPLIRALATESRSEGITTVDAASGGAKTVNAHHTLSSFMSTTPLVLDAFPTEHFTFDQSIFDLTLKKYTYEADYRLIEATGICDPLSKMFTILANQEFFNFAKSIKANAHPVLSFQHLVLLRFILKNLGLNHKKDQSHLFMKKASNPIEVQLRNGTVVSALSAEGLADQLLSVASVAQMLYVGANRNILRRLVTLPKGVYTLSFDRPIAHTIALHVINNNDIRFFDPSKGSLSLGGFSALSAERIPPDCSYHIIAYGSANHLAILEVEKGAKPSIGDMLSAIDIEDTLAISLFLKRVPAFAQDAIVPPVHVAVSRKKSKALRFLLEVKKLDPDLVNRGDTSLTLAIKSSAPLEIIDCLIRNKANLRAVDDAGVPPIFLAIGLRRKDIVARFLQEEGFDLITPYGFKKQSGGEYRLSALEYAKRAKAKEMEDLIFAAIQKWARAKKSNVFFQPPTENKGASISHGND